MKKNKVAKKEKIFLSMVLINLVLVIYLANFFLTNIRFGGIWEWMIVSTLFLLIAPLFVVEKIFKRKSKEYFLQFVPNIKVIPPTIVFFVCFVAALCLFVVKLNWQESIRVSSWVMTEDVKLMLFIDLFILPVVVFSKEFFFRGFVMKSLVPVVGVFSAILIQSLLFLTYEMGVEIGEIISWKSMILVVLPSIFFGAVAYKSKSIVLSSALHWIYLLTLDIYFYYQFTL